ncbi:hypothetical protein [uncultured Treponema sp.]|mgnify:CR=1 FL=1|uniref:hypothetical protein n=1 Tax=uncultured Treponema sp. TaxID=162155 RepID=UPI000E912F70|nr:hypothetical protein [uncultured Treponema sp.]HAZ97030.1 hypothetical protein [Treponema sp.]
MKEDFADKYHRILCKKTPDFLSKYISLPILKRLEGVGLLCGTDWTPLFHNNFFYSRLDHSIGTALIVWNFTKDKKQTISALLHDVSTPAFSHVSDFKNGDALTQSSTENLNAQLIENDSKLLEFLKQDGINVSEVSDYHIYPIADNEIPGLSADRLEYMYPSGAALDSVWTLTEIENSYNHINVLKNEKEIPELGFLEEGECLIYTKKFIQTSMILQRNEDKIAMQLMADILKLAEESKIIKPNELFTLSEKELIELFTKSAEENPSWKFSKYFRTFRGMKKIFHSETKMKGFYCVNLQVKRRYINPLVKTKNSIKRISEVNKEAKEIIEQFLHFNDTKFGCLEFL